MIKEFKGDNDFLSNFYHSLLDYEGITYPTVEHAFQAAKTFDVAERKAIAVLETPGASKRAGRKVKLRFDWQEVKLGVMAKLVGIKFSDPELKDKLKATGDQELQEGNTWNDKFWGVDLETGEGQNHLGKILMGVRKALKIPGENK